MSNTQKIILKKQHKQKTATESLFSVDKQIIKPKTSVYYELERLYDFDQVELPENEKELVANQRFEKIIRLNQLGIFIDEAHHAFGRALDRELKSLRITVNEIAARTSVVGCYNFTGTPYIQDQVLPEVVYAYGLKDAIDNEYLKEVELKSYANVKSKDFINQIIRHFWETYNGQRYEGMLPKLAIFASQVEELQQEVKPIVEDVLSKLDIPLGKILVNVGGLKYTSNDDIREFNKLDTPSSDKQFILLVNKGREGWNCRSLIGCAMYRKPRSRVFVLQATMRCLRAIGDVQETASVYLSEEYLSILDDELQQNFRVTVEEINKRRSDTIKVQIHVKKPPVTIKLKHIKRSFELKEKESKSKVYFNFNSVNWDEYKAKETTRHGMRSNSETEVKDISDQVQQYEYSYYMLVAEISNYLRKPCLIIEQILTESYEGMAQVLKYVNKFNKILYDVIIPKLFSYFYDIVDSITTEEEDVELAKPPESGFYPWRVRKNLLVKDNEEPIQAFTQKSFHLDKYCFASGSEKDFFLDFINRNSTSKIYFTGMLTHGQSDFFVSYIDPLSHTVRKYFPDFLVQDKIGNWTMFEIKADYMIDDRVIAAKELYAAQMSYENQMRYEMVKASEAGKGQILS